MKYILILTFSLSLFSCTEDQVLTPTTYYPLRVGNYWVYDYYKFDLINSTVEKLSWPSDSVYIEGIEEHSGNRYFVLKEKVNFFSPLHTSHMIRDSAGYLIDLAGKSLFSPKVGSELSRHSNFIDGQHMYDRVTVVEQTNHSIVIDAGLFETPIVLKSLYTFYVGEGPLPRSSMYNAFFAPEVGKIWDEAGIASEPNSIYIKKLVRYSVK